MNMISRTKKGWAITDIFGNPSSVHNSYSDAVRAFSQREVKKYMRKKEFEKELDEQFRKAKDTIG